VGQVWRSELGIAQEALLTGMIGRFNPRKGIEVLVDAAARLADRHPQVEFLLVGEATGEHELRYITRLRDRILALGLWNRFHIVGARSDVPALMSALDVLVLSSFEEGFGRVIIEAMARSRPVVATDQGGPREIVEDGLTGRLVPPGDAIALACALDQLCCDPELRRRMGEAGRLRVVERFALPQHVRRVTEVYDQLLDGGPRN